MKNNWDMVTDACAIVFNDVGLGGGRFKGEKGIVSGAENIIKTIATIMGRKARGKGVFEN